MATLRITLPESTINYIQNPAFRYGITGWSASSASLTQVLTRARFGIASMKVVTNGSALNEGAYYRVSAMVGISDPITASVYVRGTGRVRLRLIDNPAGKQWLSERTTLRADRWIRLIATGISTGSNDVRLYVETDGDTAQTTTFYVDGAQMERKHYPTTYCDGDQPGCRWNIVAHASRSSRDAATRLGGRWVELSGPTREMEDLYMTEAGGLGMAPISNNAQPYATSPGGYYQGTKVESRVLTFTFHAKFKDTILKCTDASLRNLHNLRQMLINAVKPDRTGRRDEFLLEYQDGDYPLYTQARYDGGLGGDWDVRNSWINSFPLRLLAMSPFVTEDSQDVDSLEFSNDLGVLNNAAARMDGAWGNMNYGFNNTVRGMTLGPDGKLYAFGDFTVANNSVSATSPTIPVGGIAYWNGEEWTALGNGAISAGGYVAAIAIAPNGYIYVTGSFTSIGGVAAASVAYWDGSSWNAMGTGLGSNGQAIGVAPDGDVYVAGAFSTAGGNAAYRVARYDGAWHSLGTYAGLNGTVYALAITADGAEIYFGGAFTDEQTNPLSGLNYICKYTIATNTFGAASADGMNGTVYAMAIAEDGRVYAAGAFTLAGGGTVDYAAYWNGAAWKSMGTGLNGTGLCLSVAPDGNVLCGGAFTEAGGEEALYAAKWNGDVWLPLDISIASTGTVNVNGLVQSPAGDYFLGGSAFSTGSQGSKSSARTTITYAGSAETPPCLYIQGPGNLRWLENQSSGKVVRFNLDLLTDEEVFLDFGRGTIVSTVRGSLVLGVLRSSDFRDFLLSPGENIIAAMMLNDVGGYMQISSIPRHWGMDSTQLGESL